MNRIIQLLRTNKKYNLYTFLGVVAGLILSVFLMPVSASLSMGFVGLFFILSMYLYYFLGIDPYYKGIFYATIPVLLTVLISEALRFLPEPIYRLYTEFDTTRGGITLAIFTALEVLVVKRAGVKPYYEKFEEEEQD